MNNTERAKSQKEFAEQVFGETGTIAEVVVAMNRNKTLFPQGAPSRTTISRWLGRIKTPKHQNTMKLANAVLDDAEHMSKSTEDLLVHIVKLQKCLLEKMGIKL